MLEAHPAPPKGGRLICLAANPEAIRPIRRISPIHPRKPKATKRHAKGHELPPKRPQNAARKGTNGQPVGSQRLSN